MSSGSGSGGQRGRWSLRPGTVRGRMALLAALAVFVAVTAAGAASTLVTVTVLRSQIDAELVAGARNVTDATGSGSGLDLAALCPTSAGAPTVSLPVPEHVVLEVYQAGHSCRLAGSSDVDVTDGELLGSARGTVRDARSVTGQALRVLAVDLGGGRTLIIGRDLEDLRHVVGRLPGLLLGLSLIGALLALLAGLAVARAGLRPVGRLADVAEEIARTQNLSVLIDVPHGRADDEVTRLADAFNRMTSALLAARDRQARLVADAGHELRTPLTSLRTNVDLLLRSERSGRPLPTEHRDGLLTDLRAQLDELSHLAGELTVLSNEEPARAREPVRLDAVIGRAIERAGRRAGGHRFEVRVEPWTLVGDEVALERATVNVLDNAVKFAPPGTTISVQLARGTLTVDDAGPGIAAADRARAVERFWRSEDARALPGSGLGLAIVADTVRDHGGTVQLHDSPAGGLRVVLTLPGHTPTGHTPTG